MNDFSSLPPSLVSLTFQVVHGHIRQGNLKMRFISDQVTKAVSRRIGWANLPLIIVYTLLKCLEPGHTRYTQNNLNLTVPTAHPLSLIILADSKSERMDGWMVERNGN